MIKYINSERLKHRRTFYKKLFFIMPVVCILTAFFLMAGNYVQSAGYNWWYMLFLPFTFIYIGAAMIKREKKYNFHGMFTLADDKKKLWYGKVIMGTIILAETCMIFWGLMLLCGWFISPEISFAENTRATVLLILTFLWQIPLFMYVTLKSNQFFSVAVGVFLNFGIAAFCAEKSLWWIPFAIPAKLMCYAVRVRPNGLTVPQTESLCGTGEVITGTAICVVLYVVMTLVTAKLFEKQE